MSTNKRINCDTVGKATKKLCLRESNCAFKSIALTPITPAEAMDAVEVLPTPIKPESDKKNYRLIRLSNGLKALLISDPSALEDLPEQLERCSSADNEAAETSSASEDEDEDDDEEDGEEEPCDKRQKQAACALCVDVGSFSDPWDIQGLAHFLGKLFFIVSYKNVYCVQFVFITYKKKWTDQVRKTTENSIENVSLSFRAYDLYGLGQISE